MYLGLATRNRKEYSVHSRRKRRESKRRRPALVSERFRYNGDWNCRDEIGVEMGSQVGDRISELPDTLLSQILSFLLTKEAVRTSILSKRWKNIWASVPCLDFEYEYSDKSVYMPAAGFVSFVDRVLYYRDPVDIHRFRLHFRGFPRDYSLVDRWIQTAVRHNVTELDLCVSIFTGLPSFQLPQSVFCCKTLVVLKLKNSCFRYAPPVSGSFPNLKVLDITLNYPDRNLLEGLFSYFPVLEDLSVDGEWSEHAHCNVRLFVPKLKRLSINLLSTGFSEDLFGYYFSINAPKLEFLNLRVDILPSMSFDNPKSLVNAVVEFYYHHDIQEEQFCNRATEILASVSNVRRLSLSAHILDAPCIPAFGDLVYLNLVLNDCYRWEVLVELLKKTPNLKFLVLGHNQDENCKPVLEENSEDEENLVDQDAEDNANPEDKEIFENEETSVDEGYSEHPWWNCEESTPLCLLSHLKTVLFKDFTGRRDEKQVAKYLLKNGKVLEEMTIYVDDFMYSRGKLCKEFRRFERGSMTCRLTFVPRAKIV